MKKMYAVIIALCFCVMSYGQLKPPVQDDTLVIQSVKYNYSDIRRENWPCKIIIKSTNSFRFDNQVAIIKTVSGKYYDCEFMCDYIKFQMEDGSVLNYYEKASKTIIVYSGYEFECNKSSLSISASNLASKNIQLKGRNTVGVVAKPEYNVQDAGTVVVTIWVDQYGTVTKAQPGAAGTTVNNSVLWNAARKAALATHFNVDGNSPALQQGTITYIFTLKK